MSETIKAKVNFASKEARYGNFGVKLSGYDEWFRVDEDEFDAKVFAKGNTVQVKAEENDRGDMDVLRFKLIAKGKPGGSKKGGGGYRRGGGGGGMSPERQEAITWQHSQEMAIAATELLFAAGAIKVPKTKVDAAEAVVLGKIDELTVKFYQEVESKAPLKAAKQVEEDLEDDEEPEEDEGEEDPDWDED